jgi:hypothetical protein
MFINPVDLIKGAWYGLLWGFQLIFGLSWVLIKLLWPFILLILLLEIIAKRYFYRPQYRNNRYWYNNIYIDRNGYKRFSNSKKLVSRWMAEKKLGRKLNNEEIVHHKNRNKLDNNPKNLWVFRNQDEHEAAHEEDGDFNKDYEDYDDDYI